MVISYNLYTRNPEDIKEVTQVKPHKAYNKINVTQK